MTRSVFAIMQVGSIDSAERARADEVTDYVIKPVLAEPEFSLALIRADQDATPGSISPKMLSDLLSARVVIADLTGRNPNVYYELGVAHAFRKTVIALGQSTGLPFDIRDERVIPLPAAEEKLGVREAETAKNSLREALTIVLQDDYLPTSPLSDIAAKRSLDELAPHDPVAAELAALREGFEEIQVGLLTELAAVRREVDRQTLAAERQERFEALATDGTMGRVMQEALENPQIRDVIAKNMMETIPKSAQSALNDLAGQNPDIEDVFLRLLAGSQPPADPDGTSE